MSNFSNSPLAENNPKYHATSNNYTEGRVVNGKAYGIDTITLHCWVGHPKTKAIHASPFQKSKQCSCNYGIMDNGDIYVCVEEKNRSWCSSNRYNDVRAVTVEISSDTTGEIKMTDEAVEAAIKLSVDVCKRNGIKNMTWIPDKEKAVAYQKNMPEGEGVFTVHRWFANKSCPGDYLYKKMGWLCDEVNRRLGVENTKPAPAPSQPTPAPAPAAPSMKTIDEIAKEVIDGKWGNGADRRAKLTAAGYDYNAVQGRVNEILGYKPKSYYRVQCGAFRVRENAESLASKIKAKGHDTYIVNKDNLFKVQLGAFSDRQNAEKLSVALSFEGFDTYIVKY